jgi:hypothetical protein
MFMLQWLFALDATVQVAILGAITGAIAGGFGLLRVVFSPHTAEKENEYGPKPIIVELSDKDRAILETLNRAIDAHADAIERHRNDLYRHVYKQSDSNDNHNN